MFFEEVSIPGNENIVNMLWDEALPELKIDMMMAQNQRSLTIAARLGCSYIIENFWLVSDNDTINIAVSANNYQLFIDAVAFGNHDLIDYLF